MARQIEGATRGDQLNRSLAGDKRTNLVRYAIETSLSISTPFIGAEEMIPVGGIGCKLIDTNPRVVPVYIVTDLQPGSHGSFYGDTSLNLTRGGDLPVGGKYLDERSM